MATASWACANARAEVAAAFSARFCRMSPAISAVWETVYDPIAVSSRPAIMAASAVAAVVAVVIRVAILSESPAALSIQSAAMIMPSVSVCHAPVCRSTSTKTAVSAVRMRVDASVRLLDMSAAALAVSSRDLRRPSVRSLAVSLPAAPRARTCAAVLPVASATALITVGVAATMVSHASASTLPLDITFDMASIAPDAFSAFVALVTNA